MLERWPREAVEALAEYDSPMQDVTYARKVIGELLECWDLEDEDVYLSD